MDRIRRHGFHAEEKIAGTGVYLAQAKACGHINTRLNNYDQVARRTHPTLLPLLDALDEAGDGDGVGDRQEFDLAAVS
jgi:hypothetical protein